MELTATSHQNNPSYPTAYIECRVTNTKLHPAFCGLAGCGGSNCPTVPSPSFYNTVGTAGFIDISGQRNRRGCTLVSSTTTAMVRISLESKVMSTIKQGR